jgi:hypothetical protein
MQSKKRDVYTPIHNCTRISPVIRHWGLTTYRDEGKFLTNSQLLMKPPKSSYKKCEVLDCRIASFLFERVYKLLA